MPGFLFYDHAENQTADDDKWGRYSCECEQAKCDDCGGKVKHRIFQRLKEDYGRSCYKSGACCGYPFK